MCLARTVRSAVGMLEGEEEERRSSPDLLSSPEVFTCRSTFKGVARSGGIFFCKAVAALIEDTVWIE